jgi:hypothetical protein
LELVQKGKWSKEFFFTLNNRYCEARRGRRKNGKKKEGKGKVSGKGKGSHGEIGRWK